MTPGHRRLAVLVASVVAVGVALALALGSGGSDPPAPTAMPQGGSGYQPAEPRRSTPLTPPTGDERERQRRADAELPVPLARAAARLFLVGFPGTPRGAPARLDRREWGAVLVDGGNVDDAAQLTALTRAIDATARRQRRPPPLVVAAQLGGDEVAVRDIGPAQQGRIQAIATARDEARTAGRSLRRLGVDMALAPSADLAITGGPWEGRGFSDEPAEAARLVANAVAGWNDARVGPIVGHFPGEGTASQDPELGVATVGLGREELRAADQLPFRAAATTAPAVQLSGALYAGFDAVTPATLDPAIVGALRADGFRGAVVSSNLTAATLATGESVGAAAVAALLAGCDLLLVPGDARDQEDAYAAVIRAVRNGTVPVARVVEALGRIDRLRRAQD